MAAAFYSASAGSFSLRQSGLSIWRTISRSTAIKRFWLRASSPGCEFLRPCELATSLEKSGARVWAWPALAIDEPDDDSLLSEAINNLFGYDWLILKNAYAADYFLRRFLRDHQPEELEELRVLTIGSEAAEKASELCVHVDIALDRFANAK